MKIEIDTQHESPYNTKVCIEANAEDASEVIELFKQSMLALGFHPNTVKEAFNETEDTENDNNFGEKMEDKND